VLTQAPRTAGTESFDEGTDRKLLKPMHLEAYNRYELNL
jgi:hypothetical protein